jgi:hypothetical protein
MLPLARRRGSPESVNVFSKSYGRLIAFADSPLPIAERANRHWLGLLKGCSTANARGFTLLAIVYFFYLLLM